MDRSTLPMVKETLSLLITAVLLCGCGENEQPARENSQSGARQAVKEVITKDFKIYESAKDSLKESQERAKARSDLMDKELK